MKITKTQLKRIIKEELETTMNEGMLQDIASVILRVVSPQYAKVVELIKKRPALTQFVDHPEAVDLLAAMAYPPKDHLARALELNEDAVVAALHELAEQGLSPKAFSMALASWLGTDGSGPIDMSPFTRPKISKATSDLADRIIGRAKDRQR